jgi:ubiquitin-protein ligase E3 A
MRSVHSALEDVEIQLHHSAPVRAGRAMMHSIRSALHSIRRCMEQEEEEKPPRGNRAAADVVDDDEEAAARTGNHNDLCWWDRLRQAELAHTNHIPLPILRHELERRRSGVGSSQHSSSSSSNSSGAVKRQQQQRDDENSCPPRGVSSTLIVSRRLTDLESPQQERDDHHVEQQQHLSSSFTPKKLMASSSSDQGDYQQGGEDHPTEESDSSPLRPAVLLTKKSRSSLNVAQEAILFPEMSMPPPSSPLPSSSLSLMRMDAREKEESFIDQQHDNAALVYSWGAGMNSFHDDMVDRDEPTRVVSSHHPHRTITSLSVGDHHSAAATSDGTVLVVGHNLSGEVDPTNRDQTYLARPTIVESLPFQAHIVAVSCGHDHTAALRSNGTVLTWGSNEYGQLGHRSSSGGNMVHHHHNNAFFCRPAAMALSGAYQRATAIACGDGFTICLTSRMELLAFGIADITGHNSTRSSDATTPKSIPGLKTLPIVAIAAGRRHAVAITSHGTAYTWGDNASGQCGQAFPKSLRVPVMVKLPSHGNNSGTELLPPPLSHWRLLPQTHDGDGDECDTTTLSIPDEISIDRAACGSDHTVLVTKSGSLFIFGNNAMGQLGVDSNGQNVLSPRVLPHPMAPDRKFIKAEAGIHHTIVLDEAGDVWQMGRGNPSCELILQGKFIQTIGAGGHHSIAVTGDVVKIAREMSDSIQKDEDLHMMTDCVEGLLVALASQTDRDADLTVTKITSRTEELLRTPAVLNSLFMNPNDLDELFKELLRIEMPGFQKALASSIERGMMRGLESVREDEDIRLMWPEQCRFLLLMLQCPLFVEWKTSERTFDRRGDLMLTLCDVILSLPFEGYKALMVWATHTYSAADFQRLILQPLHSQLAKCLSVEAGAERRPLKGLVAVLKWLHSSSRKTGGVGKAEDFYNTSVCTMSAELLFHDLQRYKNANGLQRKADFFFSANSFLMSPTTKRNLLHIESEVRMMQNASSGLTYNQEQRSFEFHPYFVIDIDREHLLQQTLDKISRAKPADLRKKLKVVFKGEDGVDGGGVAREYFQLLTEQLFDRSTGMWSPRYEETTWFNSDCFWNDEGYYLSGVLVGLAVYNAVLLDVAFPPALYRKLLGLPLGLEDMIDEQTKAGLQKLLDYDGDDVEDVFCLSFDVSWDDLGEEKRKELKPGGSDIAVTSDNKQEYVLLYVRWLLVDSIQPQYESFMSGFMKVMEGSSLDLLDPYELELLVVGTQELDFAALERRTEYDGGFDRSTPVIGNLWRYLQSSSREEQLMFLKFTTGSSKAPIGGLGSMPFKVQRAGPDGIMLPTSHTCFNTLLLPDYGESYDKLALLLGRAIMECEGFGLH